MRASLVDLMALLLSKEARHPEAHMVPRPVVVIVVLVLLAILGADVGAQLLPGSTHVASPVIDGGIIATIAAIITGAKGPKPEPPPVPPMPPPPPPPPAPAGGRHQQPETLT